MVNLFKNFRILFGVALALLFVTGCSDKDSVEQPVAGFTYTVTNSTVVFTNTSTNALSYQWDFGDGQTSTEASPTNVYKAAGDYTVKLTATGEAGSTPSVKTEKLTSKAPPVVNLLKGGSFEKADAGAWTILHSGQKDSKGNFTHVKYEFGYTDYKPTAGEGGSLYIFPDNNVVNPSEEGTIFYQKLDNLKAGNYKISALIRCAGENKDNPKAAMNSYWFEIVVNEAVPVEGNGYDNGRITGWYYGGWTNWQLVVPVLNGPMPHAYIADSKADKEGKFTLAKDGTYYLVIKTGKGWDDQGASFGDGIALDNLVISKID